MLGRVALLVSLIALSISVIGNFATYQLARQGAQAHDIQCTQRKAAVEQLAASKKYLEEVAQYEHDLRVGHLPPRGRPPIRGITKKDIDDGIARNQRILDAYEGLNC